ncbi:MAG TPA: alpha-amylase family glycosyl hydrolase [Kofleriaceae bacterium]
MSKLALVVIAGCTLAPPSANPLADPPDAAAAGSGETQVAPTNDWHAQVLYLALPDRFRDGDPTNNDATHCFDPSDPRRFHGGDIAGLRAHLDYLHDLGATAVWITPPNKQAGPAGQCGYHGYWIDYTDPDDAAIEPELGTADDVAGLSADLHARGMRFVLDMVVNHAGDTSRIARQHADWFHDPRTCGNAGNPDVFCPLDNHPDFAQEKPEVAAYLSALEQRAVTRYALDGIRMDTAKHVLPAYFHDSFFPAVRAARSDVWSLAEIFDEGSTTSFRPYLDAGFDSAFHYPLYAALVSAIGKSGSVDDVARAVASGIATVGADRAMSLVLFADDHDVARFTNQPGVGVPEDEIRRRLLLAYDLVFTLPGIPLLYYGDELGMYGGGDPDNRRDLPAWAMDPAARAQPHPGSAVAGADQVFARVQKLAHLRTTVPALATGAYKELWRQNGAQNTNVFAFSRGTGAGMRIVVIGNGSRTSGPVAIPIGLPDGTQLVDELGDGAPATLAVSHGAFTIALPARSAAIYRAI